MVLPFLTVYLTTVLNFSLTDAGILVSAFGFGSFAGAWMGGKLSDRFGPVPVIVASLLSSGLLLFSLQFAETFISLFILIFITALLGESYRPAMYSMVGDYVPKEDTGRTMALLRLSINLGFTAAPAIGGFIAAGIGYSWLFNIDAVTCIVAGLIFYSASRNWKKHEHLISKPEEDKIIVNQNPYTDKRFLIYMLGTLFMAFGFMQWFHSIPVFIKTEWNFDERYIGMMMAMNGLLISLIEMPVIHAIEKRKQVRIASVIGIILIGFSFLPFLMPAALILCFIAMLFMTVGEILHFPFNSSVAVNMSPAGKRGEYMALYSMTWALAQITGPVLGLTFITEFGFHPFWILAAGLTTVSVVINFIIMRKIEI